MYIRGLVSCSRYVSYSHNSPAIPKTSNQADSPSSQNLLSQADDRMRKAETLLHLDVHLPLPTALCRQHHLARLLVSGRLRPLDLARYQCTVVQASIVIKTTHRPCKPLMTDMLPSPHILQIAHHRDPSYPLDLAQ